jgi:hypothetical protein
VRAVVPYDSPFRAPFASQTPALQTRFCLVTEPDTGVTDFLKELPISAKDPVRRHRGREHGQGFRRAEAATHTQMGYLTDRGLLRVEEPAGNGYGDAGFALLPHLGTDIPYPGVFPMKSASENFTPVHHAYLTRGRALVSRCDRHGHLRRDFRPRKCHSRKTKSSSFKAARTTLA